MALLDEFDAVTHVVAPELGVAEWAVKIVAVILACGLAALLFWWLFLSGRDATIAHQKQETTAVREVGKAEGNAGAAAVNAVAGQATKETIIHERTNTNTIEITRQPGAGDPVSAAVDGAGRRAICMRASAAGLPDCQRLQEASP